MCYKLTKEKLNCKLPISSRRKEKTNVLVCATFTMTKQPFILGKRCSFLLVDIGIFIDFFVLEKKKTKMCSVDRCRSSIFKKGQEKQSAKFDCPVHQIKMSKKDKILLECAVSTSAAKRILKGVLVTKGKMKSDVNTIPDLIRDEKYEIIIYTFFISYEV